MQALITSSTSQALVAQIPIPQPGPGEIRVRVKTIALNPVDGLYVAHPHTPVGRTVGSDFAGVVDSLGSDVKSVKVGERVAGFLHGACQVTVLPGAFAEYLVVDADLVYKIPSNITMEEASTISLCLQTASNGLLRVLGMELPWSKSTATPVQGRRPALFIYSAATSVGCYAIQLARLSPSNPVIIVTASPSNEEYLKSLGADFVVDYHLPDWIEQVRQIAAKEDLDIKWGLDCISEDNTVEKVSEVFVGEGKIACINAPHIWSHTGIKQGVVADYMSVWTLLGKEFWYGGGLHFPAEPTHRALAVATYAYISAENPNSPLANGSFKANTVRLMEGGLQNIPEAFPLLGSGGFKVQERNDVAGMRPLRAEKMVYRIAQDD